MTKTALNTETDEHSEYQWELKWNFHVKLKLQNNPWFKTRSDCVHVNISTYPCEFVSSFSEVTTPKWPCVTLKSAPLPPCILGNLINRAADTSLDSITSDWRGELNEIFWDSFITFAWKYLGYYDGKNVTLCQNKQLFI